MASDVHGSRSSNARKICRSILNAITDAILVFDPHTFRIVDVNDRATEIYKYSRSELIGKELQDLTNEIPSYAQILHPAPIEATHHSSKGEKLEFLISVSLIEYWGRKAVLSINRDIRDLKRIQSFTAASEKKFRLLVQNISEIVALIDGEGIVQFISPQAERVLGVSASDIIGHDVFDFVHPEDRPRARDEYTKTVGKGGEGVPSVLRFRDSAGKWLPLEIIANNQMHDPDIGGVVFTARDLRYRREVEETIRRTNAELDERVEERTMELARANAALRLENQQRRYTEKQLQESLSLLNSTLESTADGILVVSANGCVRSHNKKFQEMWHIPSSMLTASSDKDLLRWVAPQLENEDKFLEQVKMLYSSPAESSLDTLKLKDGRIFERYSQPQRVRSKIAGRVWSFRDVTESQWLQEELRQAQKMEAVGRLAGGMAHDFNNVLMLISGYASQMLEDARLSESTRSLCKQLAAAIKRASSLTHQLLAFSRKHPVTLQVVDLNAIVADMEKMLTRLLSDPIRLDIKVPPGELPVCVDRSQIELMIINLALNARDAMKSGGMLAITTGQEDLEPKAMDSKTPRSYAVLQVSDTGHGMPPEISSHIFEPFFTTKEIGRGTGLGLSTVYGIVEQAGGHVTVDSEPDQGTTFRVYLPKVDIPASVNEVEPALPPEKGHETILLVEDEEGIRAMTKTYLQGMGYKILDAENGPDAIRVSREYRGTIHLLLSDILMPGMRGDDLARLIRQERPGILVVFISGYANVHDLDPQMTVLEKPFAFPDLGRQLRQTLDAADEEWHDQRRVS
jgi:two-component system cell cycle sensor histidine kinase/response regulator CckA